MNMKREKGIMDDGLFKSIVEQANDMGINKVYPFLNGEPFLDPGLFKRLSVIFDVYHLKLDDLIVNIFTNFGVPMVIHTIGKPDLIMQADFLSNKYSIPASKFVTYNWMGLIESDYKFNDGYCGRSREQICVLWDGRVTLCCMSMDGDPILGDLNVQSLEEVWNSDIARQYRENTKSKLVPCKKCNMPPDKE